MNQAVPDHLAGESQTRSPDTPPDDGSVVYRLTHLILICEMIRYRLVQVAKNLKKNLS